MTMRYTQAGITFMELSRRIDMKDKSTATVIDITRVLEKKRVMGELMNGIHVEMGEGREQDFKYLLKGYLEQDFGYEIYYDRIEDKMSISDADGEVVCNLTFGENKAILLLPEGYIGSQMENSSLGHCYKLISTFCSSWNKIVLESQ